MKHIYTYPICILLAFAAGASLSLLQDTETLSKASLKSANQPSAVLQEGDASTPLVEPSITLELVETPPAPLESLEALEALLPTDRALRLQLDSLLDGALTKDASNKIDQAINNLEFRLKLSPAQSAQIQKLANEYFITSNRDLPVNIDRFDSPLRSTIEPLLNPNQLADYSTWMDESRRNWIETQAYSEMARLQSTRLYSDEEKDILFQRITEKYDR